MSDRPENVSTGRRTAALVRLGSFVLLVLILVGILFDHADDLAIGLLGLCVATAGGWWTITERLPRRAFGIAGLAIGLVAIAVASARALDGADRVTLRVAVAVVVLAVMLASARIIRGGSGQTAVRGTGGSAQRVSADVGKVRILRGTPARTRRVLSPDHGGAVDVPGVIVHLRAATGTAGAQAAHALGVEHDGRERRQGSSRT
jgi:hypothetical protein